MQRTAMLLPTGWTMHGLHQVLSYGSAASSVLPQAAALSGCAALVGWLAARRFRVE